jgi:hippurate hydrolase
MSEETGLPFASARAGTMHACGHDTHVAMLAGAARLLAARAGKWAGEVRFMFQPGEEGHHGARFMIEDGLLDPLPQAAFALHVMPNSPHGQVQGRTGALMASADQFEIVVEGAGAMPRCPISRSIRCRWPARSWARSRPWSRAAFPWPIRWWQRSPGSRRARRTTSSPTARGWWAPCCTLSGENRMRLRACLETCATHVAAAHGMTASVTINPGFPVTLCDARGGAGRGGGPRSGGPDAFLRLDHPIMGAEDFAYVLEKVPGAMFFWAWPIARPTGARPAASIPRAWSSTRRPCRWAALCWQAVPCASLRVVFPDKGWPGAKIFPV